MIYEDFFFSSFLYYFMRNIFRQTLTRLCCLFFVAGWVVQRGEFVVA